MSADRTPDAARQRRRRHTRERQAVVFGVLLGGLAVAAFGAAAVYTGNVSLPFLSRDFSSPEPTGLAAEDSPCPPEGATPVPYGQVSLNVLNGTTRVGLAGDTASALSQRGFTVAQQLNASQMGYSTYAGTALIQFGTQGVAAAYTVAAQFDTPQLVLDTRADASVDVVVGSSYNALVAASDVVLVADQPFAVPEGCIALDQVTPVPQATPPPATEAPAEEQAAAEG
ncbi:LytR C-terminal domain-containing protein [Cellulomonas sp. ACRRI]|uniref:LytR C-terminal domain-containing protein n=1 Tax=Cellulomonas sp. ACRRI TaxID=2918188 RepID=UPI001EF1C336|nr:LytR C-terminal domain-containing protein [Cellulomonas sp. ACRRI]MCG7285184.1 LytR C-terminal domain-containing protein [Cellulomonas sp. ACRRI]